jgi:molybdopterin biosynthesis enzyme
VALAAVGSNAAAGEPDVLVVLGGVAVGEVEALGAAGRGVSTGAEPVRLGWTAGVGEQAADARTATRKAAARIRDIDRC